MPACKALVSDAVLFAGRKAHRQIQNRPNRRENPGRGRPAANEPACRTNRSRARFTAATITTTAAKDLRNHRCTPDIFLLHSVKEVVRTSGTSGRPDIRASKHPVNRSATQADQRPFPTFARGAPEPLFSRVVTRPDRPAKHPNPVRNLQAAQPLRNPPNGR